MLPALCETQIGVEGAGLPLGHFGEEPGAGVRDLGVLQFLVHAAAAREAALLHVVLPARLGEARLEGALAALGVESEDLDVEGVPAADPLGLAVLERLHVAAVAAAIGPYAVGGEVDRDEDRLAGLADDPLHFLHVARERAALLGGQVVEDGAQIAGHLLAVADREHREQRSHDREEQAEQLEGVPVRQVPIERAEEHLDDRGHA